MTPRMKLWVAASRGATSVCCSTPDGRGLVWPESVAVGPRPGLVMKALHPAAPASRRWHRSASLAREAERVASRIACLAEERCRFFRKMRPHYTACKPQSQRRRTNIKRSEEHTSELQSQSNLVCRLLLE